MTEHEFKTTPIKGLWEIARCEPVVMRGSENAPQFLNAPTITPTTHWRVAGDQRVYALAEQLFINFYDFSINHVPRSYWHQDNGLAFEWNLLMAEGEPGTEFIDSSPRFINETTFVVRSGGHDWISTDFICDPWTIYLMKTGVWHRSNPNCVEQKRVLTRLNGTLKEKLANV